MTNLEIFFIIRIFELGLWKKEPASNIVGKWTLEMVCGTLKSAKQIALPATWIRTRCKQLHNKINDTPSVGTQTLRSQRCCANVPYELITWQCKMKCYKWSANSTGWMKEFLQPEEFFQTCASLVQLKLKRFKTSRPKYTSSHFLLFGWFKVTVANNWKEKWFWCLL